ncbi:MAG: aminoacyl-tRNA hydrolase [Patescibacteria group bacterium]|jgi:PTH1 family peptidyl-tRNA hydrolase
MKLIVGLGNPGKKYEKTRHNIGFMVVDQIASDFKINKKFESAISKENNIIIAKPLTFMNESGRAVAKIAKFYKIKPANIFIIHDDKDLNFGSMRVKGTGSSAGHNGVQSIIECLGTKDFVHIRLGVKNIHTPKTDTADFVLSNFSVDEQKNLKDIIIAANEAVEMAITQGLAKTMNSFN